MFKFSDSQDLLRRFREGDRAVLESVYFAYVNDVEGIVRRFLIARGDSTRVDSGDLVQEVFLRAFAEKARCSFDGRREYGPFLGTIARNLLIDWARRTGRELPDEDLDRIPEPAPPETQDWADVETVAIVEEYISQLPAHLREVHEHRYVRCRSQEEVCADLGITRQSLRTREKHLREGLRRRLKRIELTLGSGR